MKQDLQGLAVRRQDDKLCLAAIQGLGRLVGPLPQLLVVGGLLHQVQDLGRQGLKREDFVSPFRYILPWQVLSKPVLRSRSRPEPRFFSWSRSRCKI